jgi:hypothetical protein
MHTDEMYAYVTFQQSCDSSETPDCVRAAYFSLIPHFKCTFRLALRVTEQISMKRQGYVAANVSYSSFIQQYGD